MTGVVVDASVALAWCFPDEATEYADSVLEALSRHTIFVPSLWAVELANALLVGQRSNRLRPADIDRFIKLMENLNLLQDTLPAIAQMATVLALGRDHGLTAYDATYLELAVRQRIHLATFDAKLRKAAKKAGVSIFMEAL